MSEFVILISVPGLRASDVEQMPQLARLTAGGDQTTLVPSFPVVSCSVQANMTTGVPAHAHGIVGSRFYDRQQRVVKWMSPVDECLQRPALWDILRRYDPRSTAAVWFSHYSTRCGADYVCTLEPESPGAEGKGLHCASKPESLSSLWSEDLGEFPIDSFCKSSQECNSIAWMVDSAIVTAARYQPNLFTLCLPWLAEVDACEGPHSTAARQARIELDRYVGKLVDGFLDAYAPNNPLWLVASEYVVSPVNQTVYPNQILYEAGMLEILQSGQGKRLDWKGSPAWALVDHQFAHIYVQASDPKITRDVVSILSAQSGIAEVLTPDQYGCYEMAHVRSGDLIIISEPTSTLACSWGLDTSRAPSLSVIRRGTQERREVRGSHGAPARELSQRGVFLSSQRGVFVECDLADTDVADTVLRQFGI